MRQEIAWSNARTENEAINELMGKIKDQRPLLVMFFASVQYDFKLLSKLIKEKFPSSEVVGVSTAGEICDKGFMKNSILLTTMIDDRTTVKGVLVPEGQRFPYIYKENILSAMRNCGITPGGSHHDSFAISFINGLCNAEECLLSLVHALVNDDEFQVIGGSAGDDLKFDTTYVSLNGQVVTDGGVFVFVKTKRAFAIEKENIFKPSGRTVKITDVSTRKRIVRTINGKQAASEYARILGISESEIGNASLMHPIGRIFGENIFISSIASVNTDKTFNMYCRAIPNTKADILDKDDAKAIMTNTCDIIDSKIKKPGFIFFVNCILRTLMFEKTDEGRFLANLYKDRYGKVAGFSSYGEQIGRVNSNQTLVVLAMEE